MADIASNNVFVWTFQDHQVLSVFDEHNVPYFKAKDVTDILEYTYPDYAIKNLVHIDYQITFDRLPHIIQQNYPSINATTVFLNETGLYALVLRSKQPKAGEVERWITHEVFPRTKQYSLYCQKEELTAEITAIKSAEIAAVKSNMVVRPEDVGKWQIFALVSKNIGPCDSERCSHPHHYEYRVMRVQDSRYSHSLRQLRRQFPEMIELLRIQDNPNPMNLNERIRAWGKSTGFVTYHRNDLRTTLSRNELIAKITEIHGERLQ